MVLHKHAETLATLVKVAQSGLLLVVGKLGANYFKNSISVWKVVAVENATGEVSPIFAIGDCVNRYAIATLNLAEEVAHRLGTTQSQSLVVLLVSEW